MRLISFERGDGSRIFINPLQVRTLVVSDRAMTYIQFDSDHVIMVKGTAEEVADALSKVE
jgi:hypothetical protein